MENLLKRYSTQIEELRKRLDYSPEFLATCCYKGLDTFEKIKEFLNPSLDNLLPAEIIHDLVPATERIKRAAMSTESVLIYGDYDADGICSTALFCDYFKSVGKEVDFFIPLREKHGYGLSLESIAEIYSKKFYELVITVDCGITNCKEVEYLKMLGADVIVTDHHTLPDTLPECLTVNPKIGDTPLKDLCGAGVVWKVLEQLGGKEYAKSLLDIVTIATIGDLVPLVGENRIIVKNGLEAVFNTKRKGLKMLMEKTGMKTIPTASEISFGIVPKLNAAGRMDRADMAVPLFFSDDAFSLDALTDKILRFNEERQRLCDETYASAFERLSSKEKVYPNAILLYDKDWKVGVTGIVASRIAGTFSLPAVLFKEEDGVLKGSARSVEGINIYEALKSQEHLFNSFGGHSQAAGVTIDLDKFKEFEKGLNDFLEQKYKSVSEARKKNFDFFGNENMASKKFINELALLEPYGEGNKNLIVAYKMKGDFFKIGKDGSHFKTFFNKIECVYFSASEKKAVLTTGADFTAFGQLEINVFRGEAKPQFNVKGIENVIPSQELFQRVEAENIKTRLSKGDVPDFVNVVDEAPVFDSKALYVCFTKECGEKYSYLFEENEKYYMPARVNSINRVLAYGLDRNFNPAPFDKIVFLQRPESFVRYKSFAENAKVFCLSEMAPIKYKVKKSDIVSVYDTFVANKDKLYSTETAIDIFELKKALKIPLDDISFCIAFCILYENRSLSVGEKAIKPNGLNTDFNRSKYSEMIL